MIWGVHNLEKHPYSGVLIATVGSFQEPFLAVAAMGRSTDGLGAPNPLAAPARSAANAECLPRKPSPGRLVLSVRKWGVGWLLDLAAWYLWQLYHNNSGPTPKV